MDGGYLATMSHLIVKKVEEDLGNERVREHLKVRRYVVQQMNRSKLDILTTFFEKGPDVDPGRRLNSDVLVFFGEPDHF